MGTFWDYVGKKLRLPELERRVVAIEDRIDVLERHVNSSLDQFGDYKNRTRDELGQMREDIDNLLDGVEALVQQAEHKRDIQRANSSVEGYGTTRLELTRPWQHRKLVWTGPETFGSVPEALR